MSNVVDNIEKKIFSELIKSNRRLDSFTLFKRIKVSFGAFSQRLDSLEKKEFIELRDMIVTLTLKGLEFSSKIKLIEKRHQRNIQLQPQFTCNKIPVNEFYIPTISRLDKKTFPILDSHL